MTVLTLLLSVGGALAVVALLAYLNRPPATFKGEPVDQRLEDLEDYVQRSSLQLKIAVFAIVLGGGLFFTYEQNDNRSDATRSFAFDLASCRSAAENRQQQRNRDVRVIEDFEAELARLDARIADAVEADEVPGVEPSLLPVLVFLAEARDEGFDLDRLAIVTRLEDARAEAQSYIDTFPIPACDVESGDLSIEPARGSTTTTEAVEASVPDS